MKKNILYFLFSILFTQNLYAAQCNTSETDKFFKELTKVNGRVVDWQSVKNSKSTKRNRTFSIDIMPKDRIRLSTMTFNGDLYELSNAKLCLEKGVLTVTGVNRRKKVRSFRIRRKGSSEDASIVRLDDLQFGIKIYLRPKRIVN